MARWTIHGLRNGVGHAIRGIGLVVQNPNIRRYKFLGIFLYLSLLSFLLFTIINIMTAIPVFLARTVLSIVVEDIGNVNNIIETASQILHDIAVLVPLLAFLFLRHLYPKPLDDLFMESLHYVDIKHPDRPSYSVALKKRVYRREMWPNTVSYVKRTWRKMRLGLVIYFCSLLPFIGRFAFPAAGAYATFRSLGNTQGIVVGVSFFFLPRWLTISLIRALIGMRALMRELLEPYFVRMNMSHKEKRRWFSGHKDVLFGFSAIAYLLTQLPFVGYIGYGISQAAAAYMLTVVTDLDQVSGIGQESVDDLVVHKGETKGLRSRGLPA